MDIQKLNKQEFILYAKNFNIFKTVQWPDYLVKKQEILDLLPKHNLTIEDLYPERNIIVPVITVQGPIQWQT